MTVRISELVELSGDLSQSDALPIVDLSAGETKQVTVANLLTYGISGAPSSFIDLSKLDQNSATKLSSSVLSNIGVASGIYGDASTSVQFAVNSQGLITTATGIPIAITASSVTGLAPVASSGTYASLTGLPTLGTLSSQNADSVAISGGTISGVTFASASVAISGGTISGITDLAIADGGTGASDAVTARSNLGLVIGSNVQAYSPVLSGVASQFNAADQVIYASASGVVSSSPFSSFGRSVVSGETASQVRSTLGLSSMAVQAADSVAISGGTVSGVTLTVNNPTISGGTIVGITDLAIADGGTGASDATTARTNLGLTIGTNVQAYSAVLSSLADQYDAADEIAYSSASGVIQSTSLTSLGRTIISASAASGIRSAIELGSLALQDANSVGISGGAISGVTLQASSVTISGGTISDITDLEIADGGTGASTASAARTNLGLAIGTDVQAYSLALSNITSAAYGEDLFFYTTASGAVGSSAFSPVARAVVAQTTISGIRNTLGLGDLATLDAIIVDSGNIADDAVGTLAIADGSITASKISNAAVSYAKLAPTSQSDVLLGRATAGPGTIEEITCTAAARSILDDATITDIRATLELGTLATQNGTFSGTSTGTNTGDQTIVLTGDVTGTG
ncbi:MAG: beta strand repeat-containing protein, partial [Candidatus Nanopelagicales bacterium]